MKINLTNKYVPNVAGVLRDLFIESCKMQGLTQQSNITLTSGSYLVVSCGSCSSTYTCSGLTLFSIQQHTPSWNNKCPKDFTSSEALDFIKDLYNDVSMEFLSGMGWWRTSISKTFYEVGPSFTYRIKHSPKDPQQVKITELEETIKLAQKQLEELKAIK
jgi:hypothetical protein